MASQIRDKQLFFKLVKRQRSRNSSDLATIDFGPGVKQLEGWSTYAETLATPSHNSLFNEEYKDSRDLRYLLLNQKESTTQIIQPTLIDQRQTDKHLAKMKNGKALDLNGI